jgi:hypothetical protein
MVDDHRIENPASASVLINHMTELSPPEVLLLLRELLARLLARQDPSERESTAHASRRPAR